MDIAEKLRSLIAESGLSNVDFARWVLGCDERNLYRWFNGGPMAEGQRNWISRIRRVVLLGDEVHVIVQRGAIGPQWGVQLAARKRKKAVD